MARIKVDKNKCTGCRVCELTCSAYKYGSFNIHRAHCRIPEGEILPNSPVLCLQCQNAACAKACPKNAIIRNPKTGALEIRRDMCIKCSVCIKACPLHAIFTDPISGYPIKCDLCQGNLLCVKYCPMGALTIE